MQIGQKRCLLISAGFENFLSERFDIEMFFVLDLLKSNLNLMCRWTINSKWIKDSYIVEANFFIKILKLIQFNTQLASLLYRYEEVLLLLIRIMALQATSGFNKLILNKWERSDNMVNRFRNK